LLAKEYITKEVTYIKWFSKFHKISIDEAAERWISQGLAELYAKKYRSIFYIDGNETTKNS